MPVKSGIKLNPIKGHRPRIIAGCKTYAAALQDGNRALRVSTECCLPLRCVDI